MCGSRLRKSSNEPDPRSSELPDVANLICVQLASDPYIFGGLCPASVTWLDVCEVLGVTVTALHCTKPRPTSEKEECLDAALGPREEHHGCNGSRIAQGSKGMPHRQAV